MTNRLLHLGVLLLVACSLASRAGADVPDAKAHDADKPLRAGIIGCDTSHVIAFTKIFNDTKATNTVTGVRVVAAFPGGSADIPSSKDRLDGFVKQLAGMNVEIVDSIPKLLEKVDVVLLESVDGRPHLEQVRPVLEAGKPVFIDKPLAASLADAIAIAEIAKKHNVPWFSSSAVRFAPTIEKTKQDPKVGAILGCDAWSPAPTEPHHPDLYWYGIHGVELLFTYMGPGCASVSRTHTEGTDVVVGTWTDGRIGTFRGLRDGKEGYGCTIFTKNSIVAGGGYEGYEPLVAAITQFFKSRQPPVAAEETLEIMAFMEAADESKRQGGAPVKLQAVMAKARDEAMKKLEK